MVFFLYRLLVTIYSLSQVPFSVCLFHFRRLTVSPPTSLLFHLPLNPIFYLFRLTQLCHLIAGYQFELRYAGISTRNTSPYERISSLMREYWALLITVRITLKTP